MRSICLRFPLEVRERRWELHLNDAFKNAQGVCITNSSQRQSLGFSP
jgi:hypothetical protein